MYIVGIDIGKNHHEASIVSPEGKQIGRSLRFAATGVKIPYVIKPRRAGDIATCYSDASLAEKELGWKAENGIKEMCEDSWRWQKNNPNGYDD